MGEFLAAFIITALLILGLVRILVAGMDEAARRQREGQ